MSQSQMILRNLNLWKYQTKIEAVLITGFSEQTDRFSESQQFWAVPKTDQWVNWSVTELISDWMSLPFTTPADFYIHLNVRAGGPVSIRRPHNGFPTWWLSILPQLMAVMLERQYITCMKTSVTIYVLNWILLFSRISKLENETSTCLEKGTQTDQEEESSEAVSICPAELSFNNIQPRCWDQQLQGLHLHFLSGSRG